MNLLYYIQTMKRIYFDYASTSPIDKDVLKTISNTSGAIFGNPSSIHQIGQIASKTIFEAKKSIASAIGAKYNEIIFTSGATEANNLVILGTYNYFIKNNNKRPHIITTQTEHESILEPLKSIEPYCDITYIPVSKDGLIDLNFLTSAIKENTILISVIMANNETGTIAPIKEISKIIKEFSARDGSSLGGKINKSSIYPLLHTDASQALQFININVEELGIDLLTLSAHKIYGPKGIGLLYAKNLLPKNNKTLNSPINPIILGGGQEFGFRSGTEDVPKIAGFQKSIEINEKIKKQNYKKIKELNNYFIKRLKNIHQNLEINGQDLSSNKRIPNIVNIYIPEKDKESLLISMDLKGVCASSGSACASRANKESGVLKSMGFNEERINQSIRFSFGKFTNKKEIDESIKIIENITK
ncbi:MAG: cysteine desulfurase [Candidatus Pacebacteria bacterium]|nr:cysteine desulfurase [Candidatus Paceibacterota bacterium]